MQHCSMSPIVSVRILFIYLFFVLYEFCSTDISKTESTIIFKFHSILAMTRNRSSCLFSVITQPLRQLGAILCFHVIIHIFITIHYKLTKFSTHKLHVIGQHTNNPRARARASNKKKMLKFTFWTKLSTNQVILSISKFSVRTCPRARCARGLKVEIQKFHMIWIPDTTIDDFHSFAVTLDLS